MFIIKKDGEPVGMTDDRMLAEFIDGREIHNGDTGEFAYQAVYDIEGL